MHMNSLRFNRKRILQKNKNNKKKFYSLFGKRNITVFKELLKNKSQIIYLKTIK